MEISGTKSIPDLLLEKTRLHPDKEWVVFEGADGQVQSLSYGAFSDRVNRLTNALIADGVMAGQSIALMVSTSPEFLICWFAINQAGAVMVPVNVFYAQLVSEMQCNLHTNYLRTQQRLKQNL